MKCIIIEDHAPAQHILQKYIRSTEALKLEMTCCDALEASTYLHDHSIDLIFLDINLPRFSGMEFLRSAQNHPLTILTTAYSEFALESYQFNVVDYLLKPFSFERFTQAVEKVMTMTQSIQQVGQEHATPADKYVYIKSSHDLVKLNRDDIIFIKSDSDYTEVITASNKYLTSEPLKDWVAKLNDDFKQVHKSYIINTAHLTKISHNKIYLTVDQVIPIGRAFKKHFMEKLLKFTGS
ncbi:DNA-binding response regulator [Parapedobacter pyrenivorans]|uniref:DNA-binding response regulator n=1 Tax=Parapedobacter pyrenivorans TaxID=1305674 RepID=A0A917MEA4_9SPHI|nr:LytTR family DNA-binding domain-containing protein [Parapedobacter pyrenivorans]GGH01995.1 DNA-binding response regulator [Parapedobacter pyrenivorans]